MKFVYRRGISYTLFRPVRVLRTYSVGSLARLFVAADFVLGIVISVEILG